MNYQANHILIALALTVLLSTFSPDAIAYTVPAVFYLARECYQYFALGRTKSFDWGGIVPVFISQLLAYILCVT